ncbi:putative protein-serine/threonine kinase [Dioscorea sansibarensis]
MNQTGFLQTKKSEPHPEPNPNPFTCFSSPVLSVSTTRPRVSPSAIDRSLRNFRRFPDLFDFRLSLSLKRLFFWGIFWLSLRRWEMAVAAPGQLNLDESPSWGSRSVDCFEKLEQIGEGTYG